MFISKHLHLLLILVLIVNSSVSENSPPEATDDYEYEDEDGVDQNDRATEVDEPIRPTRISGSFENQFVGTNLLGANGLRRKCFSSEDEQLLATRKAFEV